MLRLLNAQDTKCLSTLASSKLSTSFRSCKIRLKFLDDTSYINTIKMLEMSDMLWPIVKHILGRIYDTSYICMIGWKISLLVRTDSIIKSWFIPIKDKITLLHADAIILVFLWLFGWRKIMRDCRTSLDYIIRPLSRLQPGLNFILDLCWQFINHRWVNFIDVVTPCFPSPFILISNVTATAPLILLCYFNFIKFCKAMTSGLKTCT